MEKITSQQVIGLIEAYNDVYAPQELTEEQVWEEVEAWVNSLVEEGYDLSEYTWEDMYEEYLNEMGQRATTGQATAPVSNAPYRSRFARPMNAGTPQQTGRGTAVSRPQIGGLPSNYRGAELQQTARARASQVGTTRQGTAGGPTTGGNTPIGPSPTRPAATPARPAAQAPTTSARPVTQAPARPATAPAGGTVKPTASAPATPAPTAAKPNPTTTAPAAAPAAPARAFNPLMQRTFGYQTGYAPSQIKQDPKKMAVMGSIKSSFDPFDIVKGHLLDEGYADTEEAALQIMANMSEEWRKSIIG
jgi:hypothetical protein